jgi:cytosine/adenosine deaminase-related metal-dependent hydrolase
MAALGNDRASGSALSLAAHSCYAASAELIVAAKAWCRARQRVFAIHAAEHEQEVEFLQTGGGFCRHLLEALGRWVDSWQPVARTPVAYLEDLGVLDEYTLLVHAVHLTPEDWQRVAARGAAVCFCPRSNRNLGVGRPAIDQALRYGIRAGLGTDSLASNHDLSVFAEAMHVLQDHPGVSPEDAFHLATAGGAGALWQTRFGSLGPGQEAALCAVRLPAGTGPRELFANLIDHGHKGEWEWLRPLLKRSDWAKSGS